MSIKTKHFVGYSHELQTEINIFLKRNDIKLIDIKYQATKIDYNSSNPIPPFSALIIYDLI